MFCFEICPRFIPHLNPCLQLSSRTTTRCRAQQYVLLKRGNDKLLALLFLHLCLLLLDVSFMRPMMWMSSPGPSLIDLFPNSMHRQTRKTGDLEGSHEDARSLFHPPPPPSPPPHLLLHPPLLPSVLVVLFFALCFPSGGGRWRGECSRPGRERKVEALFGGRKLPG